MFERRQFGRRELALAGSIEAPLRSPIACKVMYVSRDGALLAFDGCEYVPSRFLLIVGQFKSNCHVVHRKHGLTGVVFDTPYEPA